jgi:hypothetical protein
MGDVIQGDFRRGCVSMMDARNRDVSGPCPADKPGWYVKRGGVWHHLPNATLASVYSQYDSEPTQ